MADTSLVFDILANDKTQKGMSSARKAAIATFVAIGAAALAYSTKAVSAAMKDQQSQAVLAKSLANSTGARAKDIASVEAWITKLTLATGVADDELRPALATLARATGDTATAQDQLKLAMDVSAATGKDLGTVSLALAKAQTGNVGALGRLGIATKSVSGDTLTFSQVYAKMQDQFGGAQAAKTATAAGKMMVLKNAFDEATEAVGYGRLPIVTKLATFIASSVLPPIQKFSDWMSKDSNAAKVLGTVLLTSVAALTALVVVTKVAAVVQSAWATATAAASAVQKAYAATKQALIMLTYNERVAQLQGTLAKAKDIAVTVAKRTAELAAAAATKVVTAAQWLLNAALRANPIGIVVTAIAVLVAALVLLYKKNETVRAIIQAVWAGIKIAIGAVVDWFKNTAWPIIRTVAGLIGAYYKTLWTIVKATWLGIKIAIGAVVDWFRNTAWPKIRLVAQLIGAYYRTLWGVVKVVWGGIRSAISAVVDWFRGHAWPVIHTAASLIIGGFRTLWSTIRTIWSGIQDAIGRVVSWLQSTVVSRVKVVASAIGGVWSGIAGAAKAAFNGIAYAWNHSVGALSFSIPSWVPAIGGKSWSVPDIPYMAEGGIVTRPTLAMIGEAGPEAVIPLSRGMRGVTVAPGAVQVTVNAPGADRSALPDLERATRRAVDDAMRDLLRELRAA